MIDKRRNIDGHVYRYVFSDDVIVQFQEIEIAEIKAEHLDEDSHDETDLNSVLPIDTWREKVRKVNLLLKYVERLIGLGADGKMDYPSIRILASNTKVRFVKLLD